ncbi:LysR family transcriptional regulator [Rhodovibrio salinarum]|uniref:LysR family transcriptional regulator n=1 Tax=Rhodovibrio salinarum TaxID=1087 RepID=A0A934QIG7_9PROT|nr:LysR family transcriptional regulator [Rhodovibrio salinarum]MBK1697643.1 LysR family transcriptional regulator [Rhodovibrio salinarum]
MTITHRQMQAFVAVAETRSFRAAGERINLSQPALSLAIKSLEERLGGPLIDRDSRAFELTREGAAFYPAAARLLADWDVAVEDVRSLFEMQRGRVTLGALPSLAAGKMPAVLAAYSARYPRIDVEMFDVIADRILALVREGRADFGLSVRPQREPEVAFEPLFTESFVVVHPPEHAVADTAQVTARDLIRHPFIALSRASSVRKAFDRAVAEADLGVRPVIEVEQLSTAATLVAQGRGLTAVPEACLPLMRVHGLHARPLIEPQVEREIGVLTARGRSLSVAAASLLEDTQAALRG